MYKNESYTNKFLRIEAVLDHVERFTVQGAKSCMATIELYDTTSSGARLEHIATIVRTVDPILVLPTQKAQTLRKMLCIEATMQLFIHLAIDRMFEENKIPYTKENSDE